MPVLHPLLRIVTPRRTLIQSAWFQRKLYNLYKERDGSLLLYRWYDENNQPLGNGGYNNLTVARLAFGEWWEAK